jgi:DNA-binding FadR family transcriptional regulator
MRRFMDLTCTERADFERNRKEHRRIYAAICTGNGLEASQAIRDHLHFARCNYGLLVLSPGAGKTAVRSRTRSRRSAPVKSKR